MSIKCKEVMFTPCGPLAFKIHGGTTSIVPHYVNGKDGEIAALEMPGDYFVALGDAFEVNKKPYKVNIIEKSIEKGVLTFNAKIADRTKCSLFLLPMLGGERHLFMYNNQLLNAFLGYEENIDKIVLLYRWSSDPLFSKFEQALKKFEAFDSSFDPDPYHVVFIFNIPDKHKLNYEQLKISKYSKMDDLYKLKILDFHDMEIDETLGQILFRSSERRLDLENKLDAKIDKQSELLSVLDMNKEMLNLKHYLSKKKDIRGFEE
tara:strand:+ start:827 stop:1612 length:786 start_codon:yes stop_codon:yes gene_type:complete